MPSVLELLDKAARERLINRLCELEADDHLLRERSQQRPPDPPPSLAEVANASGPHKASRKTAGVTARRNGAHQ